MAQGQEQVRALDSAVLRCRDIVGILKKAHEHTVPGGECGTKVCRFELR